MPCGVAIALVKFKYRRPGRCRPAIKRPKRTQFTSSMKKHLNTRIWSTGAALCWKMIDDRVFNAVEVINIFIGSPASDHYIVSKASTLPAVPPTPWQGLRLMSELPPGFLISILGDKRWTDKGWRCHRLPDFAELAVTGDFLQFPFHYCFVHYKTQLELYCLKWLPDCALVTVAYPMGSNNVVTAYRNPQKITTISHL